LLVGVASNEENELKKLVRSVPMLPAVEVESVLDATVNKDWTLSSAVSRALEAEANCCCWSNLFVRTRSRTEVDPEFETPCPYVTPSITIESFSVNVDVSLVYPVVLALATLLATTLSAD
jgi:hypothetical protein